jgi:RNA polymerase sigma-70 factor (sigma-E family)
VGASDAGWVVDAEYSGHAEYAEYVGARQGRLLRVAFLLCGDVERAEELLLGVLVTLARHWSDIRDDQPDDHVRRLLYRRALSSPRRTPERVGAPPADDPATAEEGSRPDRLRHDVLRALDTLTPRQRAIIVLRHVEGRTDRETAEVLGVRVGAVRSGTHDAVARLREALPDLELDAEGAR